MRVIRGGGAESFHQSRLLSEIYAALPPLASLPCLLEWIHRGRSGCLAISTCIYTHRGLGADRLAHSSVSGKHSNGNQPATFPRHKPPGFMAQITVAGSVHRMGILVHATSQSVGWPTLIRQQRKTPVRSRYRSRTYLVTYRLGNCRRRLATLGRSLITM